MSRALLTAIYTVIYLLSFYLYIYLLANGYLNLSQRKVVNYSIMGFMALVSWLDLRFITKDSKHRQFNDLAFGSLLANFILNILNHSGYFGSDGATMFWWFNGLVFANTLIILICMKRHGFFKD